jgi:uncharacterized SAM-binding protein YcdF (DUF218 family)
MNPSHSSDRLTSSGLDTQRGDAEIEKMRIKLADDINKRKFDLSKQGLKSGSVGVGLVFCTVLVLIIAAYWRTPTDTTVLSGWNLVAIIFILVGGLVGYFSLVFWREVKLAAELSKEGGRIGINTGQDVS